ncbi:hypothetical protein RBB50_007756 [Rhinocladiella similis]
MAKISLQRRCYFRPRQRHDQICFHFRVSYEILTLVVAEIFVVVVEGDPESLFLAHELQESVRGGIIIQTSISPAAHASSLVSECFSRRKIPQMGINYDEVRHWLKEKHLGSYHDGSSLPRAMDTFECYVIDCETRQIVVLQESMEYFALSYVWGHWLSPEPSNEACNGYPLDHSSRLPPTLPKTVEDALVVVKHLHGRYLWVDRYCIPSWTDKHVQIQNMDQIYRCATATIVAVDPNPESSSNSGLHGVSRARLPQQVLRVGHHELLLTGPHLSYLLARSKWVTRGWTFQEAKSSRRCLFFTENQVYYHCQGKVLSEDTVRGVSRRRYAKSPFVSTIMKPQVPDFGRDITRSNACAEMLVDIEEYTTRSLTYDTDVLHAFHGTLRSTTAPTLWGVPLETRGTPSSIWFHALLWFGQQQADETTWSDCLRPGFPSWSWLSRRSHIKFRWWAYHRVHLLADPSEIWISISISQENGLVGLSDYLKSAEGPRFPPPLKIKGLTARIHVKWSRRASWWIAALPPTAHNGTDSTFEPLSAGDYGCLTLDRVYSPQLLSRLGQDQETWLAIRLLEVPPLTVAWMVLDDSVTPCRRIGILLCKEADDKKLLQRSQESSFYLN